MNTKFEKDLYFGKTGENEVVNYLLSTKGYDNIVDVSDNDFFRDMDVDLLAYNKNKPVVMIEVKTDSMAHRTGNLTFEVYSSKSTLSIGCNRKTKADQIIYYLKKTQELLVFDNDKFVKYVKENKDNLKQTNMGDNAWGYLVPIRVSEKELDGMGLLEKARIA